MLSGYDFSMPGAPKTSNRGPAAAAGNRRAILAAARRVFAEQGYHAPLSAIAREAGVGQGVFYRHFPTRVDLAFAVFEEHFRELEALAATADAQTFGRLWSRLLELTVEEAAFVEMVVDARRTQRGYDGTERLRALLERPLERARAAGAADPELTIDDVLLAQRMVYGIVVTAVDTTGIRESIERALVRCSLLAAPARRSPRPRRRSSG
jgi:AcrR family transcriptional regulator